VANINLNATQSEAGQISLSGVPQLNAFCYLRGMDPYRGSRRIARVLRSDGKVLPAANVWTSKRYLPPGTGSNGNSTTEYRLHVFDHIPPGLTNVTWQIEYSTGSLNNHPPIISPLEDRIIRSGQTISFPVTVTDPDGDVVSLGLARRPFGSSFTTDLNGNGTFTWTPGQDGVLQVGAFPLTFEASDGIFNTQRTIILTITDEPGINAWKSKYWSEGDPNSANSADPDGDGLTNLYEYALNLDPTRSSVHQRPILTQVSQNGKHFLALTAQYRTDDPKLVVQVLGASNPAEPLHLWSLQNPGIALEASSTPPGYLRAQFIDSISLDDSSTGRFLRLHVQLLP
jgi:hypothetical protein